MKEGRPLAENFQSSLSIEEKEDILFFYSTTKVI
jgi:hypothetical protein